MEVERGSHREHVEGREATAERSGVQQHGRGAEGDGAGTDVLRGTPPLTPEPRVGSRGRKEVLEGADFGASHAVVTPSCPCAAPNAERVLNFSADHPLFCVMVVRVSVRSGDPCIHHAPQRLVTICQPPLSLSFLQWDGARGGGPDPWEEVHQAGELGW